MTDKHLTSANATDDPVWDELESVRHSTVVADARRFSHEVARRDQAKWWRVTNLPRLAATTVCGALVIALLVFVTSRPDAQTFATTIGEHRSVTLEDGSRLLLDTDSSVRVVMTRGERRVTLLEGQANFEVAHDATRPFRVGSGTMTVTAIGTNFDVTALPGRNTVTLIRGRVAVTSAQPSLNPSADVMTLQPGERVAVLSDGSLSAPRAIALSKALAWQQGRIDLEDATVLDAIAEVNRYSRVKITLRHAAIGTRRIDGLFRTGDVDAMAAALCAYFDLRVAERSAQEIVLDRAAATKSDSQS